MTVALIEPVVPPEGIIEDGDQEGQCDAYEKLVPQTGKTCRYNYALSSHRLCIDAMFFARLVK